MLCSFILYVHCPKLTEIDPHYPKKMQKKKNKKNILKKKTITHSYGLFFKKSLLTDKS